MKTQKLTESLPALLEIVTIGQIAQPDCGAEHGLSEATPRRLADFLALTAAILLSLAQRADWRLAEAAQQVLAVILVPIRAVFSEGRAPPSAMLPSHLCPHAPT